MKKFLSVLLVVMMILSTLSFAAPSAVVAGDSALALPAEDAFLASDVADDATLAATLPLEDEQKGTLIFNVDFENPSATEEVNAWPKLSRLGAQTNYPDGVDFHMSLGDKSMITDANYVPGDHLSDNTVYGTDNGNRYFVTKRTAVEYVQYDVYNNVNFGDYSNYNKICDNGIYTFEIDAKFVDTTPDAFKFRFANTRRNDEGKWIGASADYKDVDVAITTPGEWKTYTASCDTTTLDKWNDGEYLANIQLFTHDSDKEAGYMYIDNLKLYWKPATVKVTVDGNKYDFATTGVSANDIAAKIEVPTGYTVEGVYKDSNFDNKLTGTVYFTKDTTLYAKYVKDTNIDTKYGKKILAIDFENIDFTPDHTSDTYIDYNLSRIAKYYNPSMIKTDNDILRFPIAMTGTPSLVENGTGKALKFAINSAWSSFNFEKPNGDWGKGIYTVAFDLSTVSDTGFAISQSSKAFTVVDPYKYTANTYDRVVVTIDKDYLDGKGNLQFQFNTALSEVKVDNIEIFWKPEKANATLVYGEKEYTVKDVSTDGIFATSLVEQAGIVVPYGKRAVLSATKDGDSVGDTVYLVGDSKYYVSFAKDDNTSETYGQRVFLIDFEKYEDGYALSDYLNVSEYASFYNSNWKGLTVNWELGENKVATVEGNKVIRGGQGWSQFRILNANYKTDPNGVYTLVADTYNFGTEVAPFQATSQGDGVAGELIAPAKTRAELNPKTWYTVVGQWNGLSSDMTLFWNTGKDLVGDVAFDNIALYYKPATVTVKVLDSNGKLLKTNTGVSTNGVEVSELTGDIVAPFGYKVALSGEPDGKSLGDTITVVSDATLYAIYVEDKTLDLKKGSLILNADFEDPSKTVETNAWPKVTDLGAQAYYGEDVDLHLGLSDRSVLSKYIPGEHLDDNTVYGKTSDGNRYYIVNKNAVEYTQYDLYNTKGPYNKICENGVYTFQIDVMFKDTTADKLKFRFVNNRKDESGNWIGNGAKGDYVDVDVAVTDPTNFHTYTAQVDTTAIEKWLSTETLGEISFFAHDSSETKTAGKMYIDNMKLYWKPAKATVNFTIDGETVATKTDVATTGILVSTLLSGVKATGYNVGTTVKLGTKSYSSTDTVVLPGNCTIELDSATKLTASLTPASEADKTSVRAGDVSGVRFMAKLDAGAQDLVTEYGWIVTRKEVLVTSYEYTATDFTYDLINEMIAAEEDGFKWVAGKNYVKDEVEAKIWRTDDTSIFFTAVLYNIPADKYDDVLIARPYTLSTESEYAYGDPIEVSVKSVCQSIKDGGYAGCTETQKNFVNSVLG